jgi:hypothetical protein
MTRKILLLAISFNLLVAPSAYATDPIVVNPPVWTPGMTDHSGQFVPPPLFNNDGTVFQNRDQYIANMPQRTNEWFPGMHDSHGSEIPAPLYNQDGTPYVEGVSPRPQIPVYSGSDVAAGSQTTEELLKQRVSWFPGMRDPNGNVIPTPLFNPDGTPYIEGVSERPQIPIYANANLASVLTSPDVIVDKALINRINKQIKSTDIELNKTEGAYLLNFDNAVAGIDPTLYVAAENKKTKKIKKIEIKIDPTGQVVAPTSMDLSKYNVYLKRGKTTLKKLQVVDTTN